ncbi:MAG: tRNA pseudouridine(54/55) synthase Pus10 [Candidatus Aenigmatarchaeota archaeon]
MNVLEKANKILLQPICDHCLGRQFAQLLSGYGNEERGKIIRAIVAMSIDNENFESGLDLSNFADYKFHNLEIKKKIKEGKCVICDDFFKNLDKWIEKIEKRSNFEFKTFLIGTKLSSELTAQEEDLWESVGIDYCEPLKAEINREIGKRIEKKLKKKCNLKSPDVNFIVNISKNSVDAEINPIFIYGEYQKLIRGIPQTRWPSGKYKTSIEQITAKPYMLATRGSAHKLHGLGREDIDARCLAWRPFVLEIIAPKVRDIDLKKFAKKIAKAVRIRNVRFSDIVEVRKIKESKLDKTYHCIVICEKIEKKDLKRLNAIVGEIRQKTPRRVLHRRADKLRKRKVISIKTKFVNRKKFLLTVRGEAGLYVKELISGDEGRTVPSISSLLGQKCECKDLDVMEIHKK